MLEKRFAKYARAVNDERERQYLFQKFRTKTVVSIIFYILCVTVIVLALALNEYIEQDWALLIMTVIIFAWLGFAIANFCLWLSFKKTFNAILNRPADPGEMPEITSYRQKTVLEKKASFRKLWWAWLTFFICVALFIAFIVMETIKNPDGEEFGVWGGAACGVLLLGALTLMLSYIIYNLSGQRNGKTLEQQTESEAMAIDAAQGRKHEYKVQADKELQSYKYLFPNIELYRKADAIRRKNTKIITRGIIALCVIDLIAVIFFLFSEKLGRNVSGYAFPAAMTFLFFGIALFTVLLNAKLAPIEKEQKKELETNPEYADNLKWYNLYVNFGKFKGKVYLLFFIVGLALSWVLAALFPAAAWSCFAVIPMAIGFIINNRLVKNLRTQAIPIEKEIDRKTFAKLHDVRFSFKQGSADENMAITYDGDCLMPQGKARGEITFYLEETYICMEIDEGDEYVENFSSGRFSLSEIPKKEIPSPENAAEGALVAELVTPLLNGTCWRINFEGGEAYDEQSKNFLVGNIDETRPWYRIFKNAYVQLSEENILLCVLFTNIEEKI